jgi:hypothetical protein
MLDLGSSMTPQVGNGGRTAGHIIRLKRLVGREPCVVSLSGNGCSSVEALSMGKGGTYI